MPKSTQILQFSWIRILLLCQPSEGLNFLIECIFLGQEKVARRHFCESFKVVGCVFKFVFVVERKGFDRSGALGFDWLLVVLILLFTFRFFLRCLLFFSLLFAC